MATEETYMQQAIEITKAFGYEGSVEPWTRLIAEQIKLRESKPEDQPIRRGDVMQVTAKDAHPNLLGAVFVAVGTSGFGVSGLTVRIGSVAVPADMLTRIGRAKFMPDGTPVED